ncbi:MULTISPECIES: glycosyltransferase family 32 protein [Commensalibacter]|uniref:Uncharacterized protein n=3 Tax=Commensalibacter TaxID=1079922 RepID=W7E2P0_9PROT|nr:MULTISPECIES: hypothetical protein [Commensalibacter]EUK19409.1 hypothetical protein COMX_06645 [Commensalibacter papalotli (ex Servin-Garciduenas et al. 2014)]CAI3934960.1 Mannosyltransferase OCH1 or related enzyme (OCH1) [Commensalibacter papalotli (ex Botero et al. 2024)]CAI3951096.1 Mannosyltransferase OCH1 or related enzyme (OCH1) [Commensalibacter papalotli (ex Botero et al. 2024)]
MEENQLNPDVDYTDMLSICSQALDFYQQHGITELIHAFNIANILGTNQFYAEAAFFYKVAFNMHSKSAGQFPLAHFLLMARLVALLKGNFPIKEDEMNQLKGLCIPLYNFVEGWKRYKENGDALSAIRLMGNCFEEFHTGEEADTIYLTIMMDLFNPNPEICIKDRTFGAADFNVIPNNLFMYWDQNPPAEILQNFEYHKGLTHFNLKIFDKAEAIEWLYQNYGVEARQIFLSARHPAEAADFLRVHVINYYGGWWLDADIKIQSIDKFCSIIPSSYEHVFLLTHNNVVHNDFFGSVPNSPILNDCMLSLYRNSYLHTGLFIAYKTGPGIFGRALNRTFYRSLRGETKKPSVVLLNDRKFWSVIADFETPYKDSTPHWQAS